jgi:threonine dehydrogenase-like Zn-dependent dehydrogenase
MRALCWFGKGDVRIETVADPKILNMGQVHVHKYLRTLLAWVERKIINPSFVITHRLSLEDAPHGYEMFMKKQDQCIKVVLKP